MSRADIALGLSEAGCNDALARIFKVTSKGAPGPFRGTQAIGSFGVKQVSWAVTTAPTVNLHPTKAALAELEAHLSEALGDFPDAAEWAASIAHESVIFGMEAKSVDVTITLDSGDSKTLTGVLSGLVQADLKSSNALVFSVHKARYMPQHGSQGMQWLLDNIVGPQVLTELNAALQSGVSFTPFALGFIDFGAPRIAVSDGALVAFANQSGWSAPGTPPSLSWPRTQAAELGLNVLWNRFFAHEIKVQKLGKRGKFGFDIKLFAFEAWYLIGIGKAELKGVNASDQMEVRVDVGGGGGLKVKIFGVPVNIGLGITADPTLAVAIETRNGALKPVIKDVLDPDIHVQLPLPGILQPLANLILDAILKPLGKAISSLVNKIHFSEFSPPTFQVGRGSTYATISAEDVSVFASGPDYVGVRATIKAADARTGQDAEAGS